MFSSHAVSDKVRCSWWVLLKCYTLCIVHMVIDSKIIHAWFFRCYTFFQQTEGSFCGWSLPLFLSISLPYFLFHSWVCTHTHTHTHIHTPTPTYTHTHVHTDCFMMWSWAWTSLVELDPLTKSMFDTHYGNGRSLGLLQWGHVVSALPSDTIVGCLPCTVLVYPAGHDHNWEVNSLRRTPTLAAIAGMGVLWQARARDSTRLGATFLGPL